MRRFRIFHAWLAQVPDGTAAEDLPTLVGDHAISRLELVCSIPIPIEWIELACKGHLFDHGLGPEDSLSFIQEVV